MGLSISTASNSKDREHHQMAAVRLLTKDEKKTTRQCMGCADDLVVGHLGLSCVQDHHMCLDCTKTFIMNLFENPQCDLPAKCPLCSVQINPMVIERNLDPAHLEKFQSMTLAMVCEKQCLEEGEELVRCPFCPYFEVQYVKGGGLSFLYCRKDTCGKVSCAVCKKDCPKLEDGYEDEEDSTAAVAEYEKHLNCPLLREPKSKVEHALELAFKIPCPYCGIAGMKDDACTHMTCTNCSQVWCYFCGKKEADCDKGDSNGGIFSHNNGWEDAIGRRCPMYLSQLSESHDWPDHEDECLALFHRLRALLLLQPVVRDLGPAMCERLDRQFSTLSSSGFSLADIEAAGAEFPDLCDVIAYTNQPMA